MSTKDNEKELIQDIISGNTEQYKVLIEKHKNQVFSITRRILNDEEDAEEAAQDAFIKAFQNLQKFNFNSKFSTWIYRIAFNTAISYKRKQRIEKTQYEETVINMASGDTSDKEIIRKERISFIQQALKKLPELDQAILTLYYLNDYSLDEVTKTTGMKLSAVKVRLFRARKKLADELMDVLPNESSLLIS